ncbi:DUF2934 domain-containing protein [uncultured Devosia sp.]|uniref:DUF2934 domain-containing protein n=1 Tax=uncultured Devosia sp. TaxID=211434 RepID=UPI0035CAEA96
MEKSREDLIRERAYALWERAGSPGSHSQDFWRKAERELAQELGADGAKPASGASMTKMPSGTLAR